MIYERVPLSEGGCWCRSRVERMPHWSIQDNQGLQLAFVSNSHLPGFQNSSLLHWHDAACPGNLRKHVIHTVGPIYNSFDKEEKAKQLASCYRVSLELSVENALRHVVRNEWLHYPLTSGYSIVCLFSGISFYLNRYIWVPNRGRNPHCVGRGQAIL